MTRTQAFGRYELLDRVSAGGMAEVFRARDTQRGTIVALKRILPQVAEDEEFIAMLKDEARIASQLEHPHIARTLDFGHVDGEYYIAFEYVEGRDLRQIFDRAVKEGLRIPLAVLLYVFARIGEGLSYAHHRKDATGETISLVHRDVSPQNIILSFTGDVKLIDFGIAKARGKMTRTQAGTIKGKFGYMSPEQVKGVDIDHRADIFALGICMWELITVKRLFQAENELLVLDRIRNMVVPPPSATNPEVSPELDRIVLKALSRDAGDRYRAAKDFYRDINALPESTATRDEVAQFMRGAFPELARAAAGRDADTMEAPAVRTPSSRDARESMNRLDAEGPVSQKAARQESFAMAATTENKGSDLDIFEGLGKKSAAGRASSVPAPPPVSSRGALPQPSSPPLHNDVALKKPMLGAPPPAAGLSSRPLPPPPPGRASLPPVVPPPRNPASNPPSMSSAPPAASTRPIAGAPKGARSENGAELTPRGGAAGLDMDWDDEDEATHVFDKSESKVAAAPIADDAPSTKMPSKQPLGRTLLGVGTANGVGLAPPPPPPPPPASARPAPPSQPSMRAASQAPGMGPGPSSQPAFRTSAPPPPPPSAGAFARASSVPSATPGPVPFGPSTAPLPMPGSSSASAGQISTAPMPMPSRSAASAAAVRSMEATALVRPPASRAGLFVALGIAFTATVAGAVFFLTTPRTGRVVVNVNDPKGTAINRVEIFVDGKKWCDTTPCTIDPVSAGQHEVKVLADGFEVPAARPITVESRKESQLSFALAPNATRGGTGVKVAGTQPGVKLFVDDKEIGPLPAEVRDLTPGSHRVRLVGTDRYQTIEKNVTVAKDEMLDLGSQQLKVVKGKVTVTLQTPGAKVYIVSGADRRELPILPISVDIDTSKTWQLEATRPGFGDYRQPISFDDGLAEKTFNVSLDVSTHGAQPGAPIAAANPAPAMPAAGAPPSVADAPKPIAAAPHPAPAPKADPKPAPAAANKGDDGAAATGESFLDINSIPVSNVVLDGKPVGTTPKLHVAVSPGTHTVQFVNAEQSLKKTIQVKVGAGETGKAIARLKAEE